MSQIVMSLSKNTISTCKVKNYNLKTLSAPRIL